MCTAVLQWTFFCHSMVVLRAVGVCVFCALLCGCSLTYTQTTHALCCKIEGSLHQHAVSSVYLLYNLSLSLWYVYTMTLLGDLCIKDNFGGPLTHTALLIVLFTVYTLFLERGSLFKIGSN